MKLVCVAFSERKFEFRDKIQLKKDDTAIDFCAFPLESH